MLKRTQGRWLLSLLVITGLAGTLNNTSLTHKERKFAINLVKDGRSELFNSIEGLSNAQLNFRAHSKSQSIKQIIFHIAASEKKSWDILTTILKNAPNPEKRSLINLSDDQLIALMENPGSNIFTSESNTIRSNSFNSLNEALESFKSQRNVLIKYIKLSTEDLRDHVIQIPFGWIDCYQFFLAMCSHTNWHIKQIEELKSNPDFPSR